MDSKRPPQEAEPARRRNYVLLLLLCFGIGVWILYPTATDQVPYAPIQTKTPPYYGCDPSTPTKRVAIIGAGSAGASAAYYINKFRQPCHSVNVTVYERSDYVGGRSITVNANDDPTEPVELGASIFVKINTNLVSAVERFGLSTVEAVETSAEKLRRDLGVYNGTHWLYRQDNDAYGWWNVVKLLWKYRMAPIRTQRLMKETVGKFIKMYDGPHFPFHDLSETVLAVGLTDVTAVTGEKFLNQNDISPSFAYDVIQASTRVNYAQNLDKIHGLETMVCMATDGAMSVRGGNWQIFSNMLADSGAHLRLNTSVASISKQSGGTYAVSTEPLSALEKAATFPSPDIYDSIILTAPLQFANITLTPPPLNPPPPIPYVSLHVTLFTSPHRIDPQYFHLSPFFDHVPNTILTTTNPDAPPLPYYSISTLRTLTNPHTHEKEYLYKVFSPTPLNPSFLLRLLLPIQANSNPDTGASDRRDISWIYEKRWDSYPVESPRVTFDDVALDGEEGRVWYTSGIEGFVSTMETSSLMGMNVARLVVDGWMREGLVQGNEEGEEEGHKVGEL